MKHVLILLTVFAVSARAELPVLSEQLSQSLFKQLIGQWQVKDASLNAEGQWADGPGAQWHFYPVLNGHAIQDDWISPPLDQPEPAVGRQYGTNIRIYNPQKSQWEMAWMSVKGQKVDTFTAVEKEGQIIMKGLFNGQSSRITFYDIKPNQFFWKLEFDAKGDGNWQEVYRIKGNRAIKDS